MSVSNISGTTLIRENTLLPAGLTIESEIFLPGWRVVKNLDGAALTRNVEGANWNLFNLAGESTEGLTEADMVKSISAKFGPATIVAPEVDSATRDRYNSKNKPVAFWEDAQYSFSLVRSSFGDALGLVAFSKRVNAQAELAIVEALKLDEQEGPKRDAERQKKQMDDLEMVRQKNQKSFRP